MATPVNPSHNIRQTLAKRMLSIKLQLPHVELDGPVHVLPWPVLSTSYLVLPAPLWTMSLGLWCLTLSETTAS